MSRSNDEQKKTFLRTKDELTEIFERLGAKDPEGCSDSEIREGVPQLSRFLVLKRAWEYIVGEDELDWLDRVLRNHVPGSDMPYSEMNSALQTLLDQGVDPKVIIDLVRGVQVSTADSILYMVNNPELDRFGLNGDNWGLFECDLNDNAGRKIDGLHESFLSLDPTGREMRPKEPLT